MALGLPLDVCVAYGMNCEKSLTPIHVHYIHDIALVDQGGTKPTFGCVCLTNISTSTLLACE